MLFLVFVCLSLCSNSPAWGADVAAKLDQAKSAAVMVKLSVRGRTATCSGFLAAAQGKTGVVISPFDREMRKRDGSVRIHVVLNGGTDKEQTVPARYVGSSLEGGLAVLRIQSPALPKPLSPRVSVAPRTMLPVFIIGFPLGGGLAMGRDNPEVSVWKASVTSIRKDQDRRIAAIQLDGGVVPGADGSPVVDAQGRLVGIAKAGIAGSNIGLALPASMAAAALRPRPELIIMKHVKPLAKTTTTYKVEVRLSDPGGHVRSAVLVVGLPTKGDATRDVRHRLRVHDGIATGVVRVPLSRERVRRLKVFAECTTAGGTKSRSQPQRIAIAEARSRSMSHDATAAPEHVLKLRRDMEVPQPKVIGRSLKNTTQTANDATVKLFRFPMPGGVRQILWSRDGKAILVHTDGGALCRVRVPDFVEERRLELGTYSQSNVARSALGLVIHLKHVRELWLFEEESLSVKKRVPAPDTRFVATSPALPFAFVQITRFHETWVVDLATGRIVNKIGRADLLSGSSDVKRAGGTELTSTIWPASITRDGKYLLCLNKGAVHRFRIKGSTLRYEEAGPNFRSLGSTLMLSPDSLYAAVRVDEDGAQRPGHPKINRGVYIYPVTNLRKPVVTLDGVGTAALCFDFPSRCLYAKYVGQSLIGRFGTNGTCQRSYSLHCFRSVTSGLTHPAGKKLLLVTSDRFLWVEFK